MSDSKSVADLVPLLLKEAGRRFHLRTERGSTVFGLPTGIPKLDTVLGGFQPGMHYLAAKPGMGKTTFTLQLARSMAAQGIPVLFVSFEEAVERLALKLLCSAAGLNAKQFQDGLGDPALLAQAAEQVGDGLRLVHFMEGRSQTEPEHIHARLQELLAETGCEQALVVIDYVQLWGRSRGGDLARTVALLGGELRDYLVSLLRCPVLCISSQQRTEDQEGYALTLKAGGDMEYDADSVLYLVDNPKRTEDMAVIRPGTTARAIDLVIEKNRYGDTGRIELVLRPELGVFREVAFAKSKESFGGKAYAEAPRGLKPVYMIDEEKGSA